MNDPFTLENPRGTTRKRSLLIGINYVGQNPGALKGFAERGAKRRPRGGVPRRDSWDRRCHNDVEMMRRFIATKGFKSDSSSQRILLDDGRHTKPNYQAILDGFAWLTDGAASGDSLFMHYSGHGGSVKDKNSDEKDGKDETLIPVDYKTAGQITDDVILAALVLDLPEGCMLTVVIDACHSGTVLDLPYKFVADSTSMQAVSSGEPAMLAENHEFNFEQLLRIGSMLFGLHQKGASKQEMMGAVFSELSGMKGLDSGALTPFISQLGGGLLSSALHA